MKLLPDVRNQLRQNKFAHVRGSDFALLGCFSEFVSLSRSWEAAEIDNDFGQAECGVRHGRCCTFEYDPVSSTLNPLAHRSDVQSTQMNGGVDESGQRRAAASTRLLESPVLRSLVAIDFDVYKNVLPGPLQDVVWQCHIQQTRIEIKAASKLEITPEGIHCNGFPFSGIHFWGKDNVEGAHSQFFLPDEGRVGVVTYESILDTTFVLDREMRHYVTPASTYDPRRGAYHQVMVISFSRPGTDFDIVRPHR